MKPLEMMYRSGITVGCVLRAWIMLVLCVAGMSGVCAETTGGTGLFSVQLLERSLEQPAPRWTYAYTKRVRDLDGTFAFYTLSLAAYTRRDSSASAESLGTPYSEAVTDRLRVVVAGGNEPECQGGIGGWSHGPLAWALAFARHTPAVWAGLSKDEQARTDLLMQALAVAANFCLDDDNAYRCLIDGEQNWAKGMNPNHVEGYVGAAMAAAWYFGVDELDAFFMTFDFDAFLGRVRDAGFSNIEGAWTRTPDTRRVLMEGGLFNEGRPSIGLGRGVHGNRFTYGGLRLDQSWEIYRSLAERMFSKVVQSSQPVDGLTEKTQIIDTDDQGNPLRSPFEGQLGMCYEFLTTNAHMNGTRFRSSLFYVYEGWMLNMANAVALRARGLWPEPEDSRTLRTCMIVGTGDFFFRMEHGYKGFANGKWVPGREESVARLGGWPWAKAWWVEGLTPVVGGQVMP
jgi:hypothetical protein